MCLSQVFKDVKTAICDPPRGALDKEILHARLRAYWVRIQYISWNILATALLYTFSDSLLNIYLNNGQYYYNIIFHLIQSIAIMAYFITSFRNPGYIESGKFSEFTIDSIDMDHEDEDANFIENDAMQKQYNVNIKSIMDMNDNDEIINDKDYKYLDMNMDFVFGQYPENTELGIITDKEQLNPNYPYEIVRYVPEHSRNILIDPDAAPTNFCWRCKFIRPIRSKHCYDCDRCVTKFDHHCPMVGNCVAARNHRFFVLFMSAQTIVVLWAFYISLMTLFQMNNILMDRNDITNEFSNYSLSLFTLILAHKLIVIIETVNIIEIQSNVDHLDGSFVSYSLSLYFLLYL